MTPYTIHPLHKLVMMSSCHSKMHNPIDLPQLEENLMSVPELTPDKVIKLQKSDMFCKNILQCIGCSKFEKYFQDAIGILHKKVVDFHSVFSAVVVPQILMKYLLHASHNSLGHVGAMKLYHFLKQLYYFKGVRRTLQEYIRSSHKCQITNLQKLKFIDLHQDIAQTPQDHLSVDLLGPYNATSQGNLYVLIAVCNLTGYLMTSPIKDKKTTSVANHFSDIMLKFGFPRTLHYDNGMEFKSKLMESLSQQLGIRKTFISPHQLHTNGKLESSHRFIKYWCP